MIYGGERPAISAGLWLEPEISIWAERPMGCICGDDSTQAPFTDSVMSENTQHPYHSVGGISF